MALALLGGAARAVGGQMVKSGGRAMAKKMMSRGDKKQKRSVSGGSAKQDGGRSGALAIRPKTTLIPASVVKATDTKTTSVGSDGILVTIYKKVVEIDKLLKGTLAEEKALTKEKTKQDKREDRDKRESKLEKKKTKEEKKQKGLSLPGLSFFDRIKKFITTIIGGFILQKLVDFAPQLGEIIKVINTGLDVGVKAILGVVDAAGTFLLGAYDLYDQTKDWVGVKEGEDAEKKFGQFGEKLKNLLNAILIVGGAAIALGPRKPGRNLGRNLGGKSGTGFGKGSTAAQRTRNARIRNIQRKYGPGAREIYENALDNGKTPSQADAAVKRKLGKKIVSRPGADSLSARSASKGNVLKGGLRKAPGRLATKILGKEGIKLVKKIFGRIPIMGGLIVAVASLLGGEPIGQALFKGVGSALGGALGSFIPIPVIGTTIGMLAGEFVGDLLYSLILGKGVSEVGEKLKKAFDDALMTGGLIVKYFKESFGRLFKNFPTIDVSDVGWGALQKALAIVFPFLDKDGNGKVEKIPDISILNPIFNPVGFVTKLIPHAAASFFPAIFGEGGTAYGSSEKAPDPKETSKGSSAPPVSNGPGRIIDDPNQYGSGQGKQIYLHWTADGYNSVVGPYHTVFTGDGEKHQQAKYNQTRGHTYRRNTNSVGLAVAAMGGGSNETNMLQSPTEKQLNAMAKEAAQISTAWGWKPSDINIKNIMTHGEAGSNLDGRNMHDNYGPTLYGGTGERWDLEKLRKGQSIGQGGPEMRSRIASYMFNGGLVLGKKGVDRVPAMLTAGEFVIDKDSTDAIRSKLPRFLDALNKADGNKALKVLEAYASYEQGGESTVIINQNQIPASMMQQKQSPSAPIVIPVGGEDPFASAYANC